ncbi:hypothetical protein ACFQY4_33605 [Catellatospora bangladeshensis]
MDNPVRPGPAATGSGHGLIGMRERAALLGGTLTAAAVDGRWRLRAELPLRHDPAASR